MTLVVENGELVVARIIHGGMIDRQGIHRQLVFAARRKPCVIQVKKVDDSVALVTQ